ncbi:MAG: sugar ABC transporter ATP-binding protein [Brachymonas sp.]|nr:sugar ABC transporter ATP-binding protein [Brachymonas sp.]
MQTSLSSSPSDAVVASSPPPFLEVTGIHKRFAGVHALKGVSVHIEAGKVYHLLGENGCGKSTLIKIISGAQPADAGTLRIDGQVHTSFTPVAALAAGIQTVYQDLSLLPNMSVTENVALTEQLVQTEGRLLRWLKRDQLGQTACKALRTVGLPEDAAFASTLVGDLPIATRQLVAIARAVACKARLVIMDEPTTALTQREVDHLIAVVRRLQADGVAVLFVSHKLDECKTIGGDVIVFRDGEKVAQGPIANYSKAELTGLMTGRVIEDQRYRQGNKQDQVLLQVQDLGRAPYFANVNFTVNSGEIVGITGLLDSGRNELALALAGLRPATAGSVHLAGMPVRLNSPRTAIAQGIGYVPEDRLSEGLFLEKSIEQNITALVLPKLRNALGLLDGAKMRQLAESTVRDLKIATPGADKPVQSLSGGNQQRVLLGRWLTIAPRLLLLHGPTVGVDVGSKDTIYRIVQQLAEEGMGVVIISDDLPELLHNCDRIVLMQKGRLKADLHAADLTESQLQQALLQQE